jgi:flagellar FliL protein
VVSHETRSAKGSKRRLGTLLLVAAGFAVLAGGGTAAVLTLGGSGQKSGAADAGADGGGRDTDRTVESLVSFDSFVVNLADPGGDRFLKATLRAVLNDADLARELQRDELTRARVRDRIISVLSAKTFEEVTRPGGKDSLRQQLQREINQSLPDDAVSEVLFVEFVVQ